ncbi:MAG TPA: hypothetical protein VGN23_09930 [Verrucomicrobiae bacterium]|jgi:hypothetical protein
MSHKLLSKLISLGFWAIIMGLAIHVRHDQLMQMGRDAYLTKRGAVYDHLYSHPDSIIAQTIVGFIMLIFLCLMYELVAFVALKIIQQIDPQEAANRPGPGSPPALS